MAAGSRAVVLSALFLATASPLVAQTVITGIVRQDHSGLPLPGVEVTLQQLQQRTVTDSAGRFVFTRVRGGAYTLQFRMIGYRPIRHAVLVTDADTVRTDARLVSFAVRLDPLQVNAPAGSRLMGIDQRLKLGIGVFLDSSDLRRNDAVRLGDLIGRQRGVQVLRTRSGAFAMSMDQVGPYGERCAMSVLIDGTTIYRSTGVEMKGEPSNVPSAPPPDLNAFMGVPDLQAVEIYRRPSEVPMEFGGRNTGCGVVVLWTRRAR